MRGNFFVAFKSEVALLVQELRKRDWFHHDGFPISVERRNPQRPFGPHSHEFSEIVLITGGKGRHVTGQDSYQLSKGEAFVIGGSLSHDYQEIDGLSLINILFDPNELPFNALDLGELAGYQSLFVLEHNWSKRNRFESRLRLSQQDLRIAINLIDQLEKELRNRNAGYRFFATTWFMQLVGHLARCYERTKDLSAKSLLRIGQAVSFIETNFEDSISLEYLVEMSGMSRRTFLREFENATGSTPINYLIDVRLSNATELLRHSELNITQIAMRVGFNDSNYFARQFRKRFKISPRDYRRSLG